MTYDQPNQPCSRIEYLTSAIAAEMLTLSKKTAKAQRAISPDRVRSYEREIRQGRWMLTPTHCIGIANDGFIVDGRHRLSAIASLDKPRQARWLCLSGFVEGSILGFLECLIED
jgi:hypothetical protein